MKQSFICLELRLIFKGDWFFRLISISSKPLILSLGGFPTRGAFPVPNKKMRMIRITKWMVSSEIEKNPLCSWSNGELCRGWFLKHRSERSQKSKLKMDDYSGLCWFGIKWIFLGNEIGAVEFWKLTHQSVCQVQEKYQKMSFLSKIHVHLGWYLIGSDAIKVIFLKYYQLFWKWWIYQDKVIT